LFLQAGYAIGALTAPNHFYGFNQLCYGGPLAVVAVIEESHRYQFRLSYENRPYLSSGIPRDSDVRHLLWQSTACKLVSNTLELKVK